MQVWLYPDRTHEEFGAERWKCSWEQVKVSAQRHIRMVEMNAKRKHAQLGHAGDFDKCEIEACRLKRYELGIDIDADLDHLMRVFRGEGAKEKALAYGRKVIDSGKTAFGAVTVVRQVVGWYVEEDRIAEWQDTSDEETVD